MRRSIVGFFTLVGLFAILIAGRGSLVSAQDASGFADHPLVGTWQMIIDSGDGADTDCPNEAVFTSDGAYIDVSCDYSVTVGAWEPTGDNTAILTIYQLDDEGLFLIRAAITVADDGASFTAEWTFEMVDPATGEGTGEYGPGTVSATLRVAEGPGEPIGSMMELWGGEEETAEATPAD